MAAVSSLTVKEATARSQGPSHNGLVLNVADRSCEARIKEWDHWYVICLKECKDIAAGYAFSHASRNSASPTYQRELNACNKACDSKYAYYRNSICQ